MDKQELQCETITISQFMQALAGHEVHGTPVGTAYVVPAQESVQGQELLKHRVRVSFDFDVTVNDRPIREASNDDEAIEYDLALLKSFLETDKEKLLHMMMDTIAIEMGLNSPETFVTAFLPQVDVRVQHLFSKAIDALPGDIGVYWRDVAQAPEFNGIEDYLALFTEDIFACFSAEFIESSFEVLGDNQ